MSYIGVYLYIGLVTLFSTPSSSSAGSNSRPPTIFANKIGRFAIGNPLPPLPRAAIVTSEQMSDEYGETYTRLEILDKEYSVDVEVRSERIRRIYISKPGPETIDGVGIGTRINQLAHRLDLRILIGPGANIILLPTGQCGMAFWTNKELDSAELQMKWSPKDLAALPSNYVISAIVITGTCSK